MALVVKRKRATGAEDDFKIDPKSRGGSASRIGFDGDRGTSGVGFNDSAVRPARAVTLEEFVGDDDIVNLDIDRGAVAGKSHSRRHGYPMYRNSRQGR